MTWRSSQYTRIRFERFDPDLLLTTVPAEQQQLDYWALFMPD